MARTRSISSIETEIAKVETELAFQTIRIRTERQAAAARDLLDSARNQILKGL